MKLIVSLVTSVLLLVLYVAPSHAIPAFTRANGVECSTCHTIFPELNEYGEAFLKNSYVYFGKGKKKTAEKTKAAPVVTESKPAAAPAGDAAVKGEGNADLLGKLKSGMMISTDAPETSVVPERAAAVEGAHAAGDSKSEGIALAGIPEQLPISFTASLHGTYDRKAVNEFDFSTRTLKLNAGGNFREKAAFFGTYILYTESPVATSANTSTVPTNLQGKNDIGELFLVWRHALETPINIKVGRFQPKLGLWKSNNKLSTANSYATYAYTVGSQSLFKLEQPQDAIEANMIFANRVFVAGGTVNRKNQNTKEWYVHTSVKIGGADYLANEPEIDLNKEESVFDFLTMTVGGYGYFGTNGDPNTVVGLIRHNDYYRAGMDIDLLYKQSRLKLSGVMGEDDNPALANIGQPVKTYVAAVEGQYTILQNLIGSLRFEYQDDSNNIVRRFIPTLAYTPIENVRVAAEYKHEYGTSYQSTGSSEIANKIGTLGVTFGF